MTSVTVSAQSRYKDTPVFDDRSGSGPEFGAFQPPAEFTRGLSNWSMHVVRAHEVGFLDLVAQKYFGPGREMMWWSIALANGIVDTEYDMYPGQRLRIPPLAVAVSYIARG